MCRPFYMAGLFFHFPLRILSMEREEGGDKIGIHFEKISLNACLIRENASLPGKRSVDYP